MLRRRAASLTVCWLRTESRLYRIPTVQQFISGVRQTGANVSGPVEILPKKTALKIFFNRNFVVVVFQRAAYIDVYTARDSHSELQLVNKNKRTQNRFTVWIMFKSLVVLHLKCGSQVLG